ncbi:hypothetical protein Aeqsu_1171 [Aequorivita sublithincola DSM 14238]|uniref:Uncharacterized protein n=1 Tax=Aequorivita sublithincola (strain DSM 14238 / LMG 21431 / ACAM 643 / 9-3) TaxID=746697 RepID=I3YUJ9_AEQSU|nr:outer membrane beta-barrel protein [Aequorivita sublithincola]AFL80667.1 hypothetical protein Aeqsu_1171 [Aequorivita sublithincola DSM 14238]
MKKLLLLFAFLFCLTVSSQNQKGEIILSVAVSPYPTTTNNQDDFGALGLASFEFFISNKVSLSGSFFTSNNTLLKNNSDVTIHSYGFTPSIHYYFVNKEKWNVFAQAGYGFGFEDQTQGYIQNSALTIYNIGPGAHYKIGEKLYLKLLLPYFNARNITLNVDAASGIAAFLGLGFKF